MYLNSNEAPVIIRSSKKYIEIDILVLISSIENNLKLKFAKSVTKLAIGHTNAKTNKFTIVVHHERYN